MRAVSQDPPTRIRMTSVRLAEPVFLRRPWFRPDLEREDGTPLARNAAGERVAPGPDGAPVRVSAAPSPLRAGWVLHVDGRPVPSSAPSRSTGLGVLSATFASLLVGERPLRPALLPRLLRGDHRAVVRGRSGDAEAPGPGGRGGGRDRGCRGGGAVRARAAAAGSAAHDLPRSAERAVGDPVPRRARGVAEPLAQGRRRPFSTTSGTRTWAREGRHAGRGVVTSDPAAFSSAAPSATSSTAVTSGCSPPCWMVRPMSA